MRARTCCLELVEAFEAEALGEFIVDDERIARRDRLDDDVEIAGLAGELALGVEIRERRLNRSALARRDADQRLLEAGNEAVRAEHDLDGFAFAAFERLALDRADEIDRHPVVIFGRRALRLVRIGPPAFRHGVDRGVDLALRDVGDWPFERDFGEVADFEFRQHFERHPEIEIAARVEHRVDRLLVFGQLDFRLLGEAQAVIVDDLLVGGVDELLDEIGHHRAAVDLLEIGDRNLAGAKAVHPDLGLHVGQLRLEFRRQVARRQRYAVFAFQPLAQRLGDLHALDPPYP